jgi:hypothetical protein
MTKGRKNQDLITLFLSTTIIVNFVSSVLFFSLHNNDQQVNSLRFWAPSSEGQIIG